MASTSNLGIQLINSSDYINVDSINNGFEILDKLGLDYIIEQGNSGNWTYRKWKNGTAECWYKQTYSDVSIDESWGTIYVSADLITLPYPVTFSESPIVTATWASKSGRTGMAFVNTDNSSTMTGSVRIMAGANGTASGTLGIHVIGTYNK